MPVHELRASSVPAHGGVLSRVEENVMTPRPAAEGLRAAADVLCPIALELRHLRLVLAIDETGGITHAGERLHLTQSALSHQLKEIEVRLGVALFLRVKKRLVLTDAGRQVLALARPVLEQMVALEDGLRGNAAGRRGVLRLTTECYTCYDWLPPLLQRFEKRFPEVEVRIVVEATRRPLDALAEGEVDLCLVTAPVAARDAEVQALFEDELLLVTAADHPLAARRFVRPQDLAGERLLLYGEPAESKFYQQFFVRHGVAPREVAAVQLTEALLSMVKAGLGVSPFARWAVAKELGRGEVAGVRLGPRGMQRTWVAATRRTPRPPLCVTEFAALVAGFAAPSRFEERRRSAAS
jgi:LysR family transcriptional regulator for metE and metH